MKQLEKKIKLLNKEVFCLVKENYNYVKQQVEETAKAFPNKVAFCDRKDSITFDELRRGSFCIASCFEKKYT